MKNILLITLLLGSLSCSAKQQVKCGELSMDFSEAVQKRSEHQINWGEGYSCSYDIVNKKNSNFRLFYRNFKLEQNGSDIEKAISEFYAMEQNSQREDIFNKNISGIEFFCFNAFDTEIERNIEKCYAFDDKKLVRIFIDPGY